MSSTTGRYNSPRRRLQAEQTRRDILRAARRLFARDGYARTSMEEVAREAGVAVQTVYSAIGSKAALLSQLNDAIDEESGLPEILAEMNRAIEPHELVRLTVKLTRQYAERSGDFLAVLQAAAPGEPELAAIWDESRRRHRDGTRWIAERIGQAGALRPGVTVERAAQLLSVLTWVDVYGQLGRDFGLSLDDAEEWIGAALEPLVLGA